MPGIVGIIGITYPEKNSIAIREMVRCMMHEPFYTSGTYINEQLGLWLGWVSHSGSFSDCMPVWNETKNICLIFSGEDFREPGELQSLRARDHNFSTDDASYLVHLYEETGTKFFEKLNGLFCGVLVDLRNMSATLFNDRFGLKRIYYHENKDGFFFSSEAKTLLRVLPELRQIDYRGLAETFSCGCVLQNRTLFSGISLLPGASAWRFSHRKKTNKTSYFNRSSWENGESLSYSNYYNKLKETWARILPQYFQGKERIAMSLTGGVDGRMIMAWANLPPNTLPCYTFGGMLQDSVDVEIARKIARICQQPHYVIRVTDDFISQFPILAEKTVYITDGAMNVSGAADLFANQRAREIAPVRLTGNYGQEVLRSSIAFRPKLLNERLFDQEFGHLLRTAEQTYAEELNENRLSFVTFKQVPWHHFSRFALEQSQLTLRAPYLDNNLVALAFQTQDTAVNSKELSLRLITEGSSALGKIATDRGMLYRPIPLWTKVNHLYREFTFKAEYAYDYGMPQWLASVDGALSPLHLEKFFLGKHKFYHFRIWYRDKLSRYVRNILLDESALTRPYLSRRFLEKMVQDHTDGQGNYTLEIHYALSCELIQRLLIETNYCDEC